MTVKIYQASNEKLSTNFRVKEFQSHDGTESILIDSDLVTILQLIRDHFGSPVTINSAYRTPSYNAKVGGKSTSYHVKGQAADIVVKGVHPVIVGMYAEKINTGGIGVYAYSDGEGFVHVDTRAVKYRWLQLVKNSRYEHISKIMPTILQGIENPVNPVVLVQRRLGVSKSGTFGDITSQAVKKFQKLNDLTVDGIVGKNTWSVLFG